MGSMETKRIIMVISIMLYCIKSEIYKELLSSIQITLLLCMSINQKSNCIMMYHPQVCYQSACSYYNYLSPLGIRQPKLFLSTIIPLISSL